MSDDHKTLNLLREELDEKEKNLLLAAQYGKNLLEQNSELHLCIEKTIQEYTSKVENLQQENHSLVKKLEVKDRVIKSLSAEIETLDKVNGDERSKLSVKFEDSIGQLNRKISFQEETIAGLQKEVVIYKEKAKNSVTLLEEIQAHQLETTNHLVPKGDSEDYALKLEEQVKRLVVEKQDLEKTVLELKSSLKSSLLNLNMKKVALQRLDQEREEQECRLTSLLNEVERMKNENTELKVKIDQMQLDAADPRKKGNSLFAEVEDNRRVLEKRLASLTSKYSALKQQYQRKQQQKECLELHIASLLEMTTSGENSRYQQYLEESLSSTQNRLTEVIKQNKVFEDELQKQRESHCENEVVPTFSDEDSNENYYAYLHKKSMFKISSLEKELRATCFSNVCLNDELVQLRRKLIQAEKTIGCRAAEIIRLNVKVEKLMEDKEGKQVLGAVQETKNEEVEVFIEKIPSSKPKPAENITSTKVAFNEEVVQLDKILQGTKAKNTKGPPFSPKEDKENFEIMRQSEAEPPKKRGVQFPAEVTEKEKTAGEKLVPLKQQRLMKPSHTIVVDDDPSTECKVQ